MERPIPGNEDERLRALHSLDLLDTPAEERFDRLTRLAGRLFQAPVSMFTFVDRERQWFKSAQGHLISETPRIQSFCQYTIMANEPLVVQDARSDSRFFDLPVVFDMGVRFYAGVPVRHRNGQVIGTLCILDFEARKVSEADQRALLDLGRCTETELQVMSFQKAEREMLEEMDSLRRRASIDQTARCWSASMGRDLLSRMLEAQKPDSERGLGVLLITLNRLNEIAEKLGHEARDHALRAAADRIRMSAPDNFVLSRSDLATYMILLSDLSAQQADEVAQKICDAVGKEPHRMGDSQLPLEVSAGLALSAFPHPKSEPLLDSAVKAMGRARQKGANSLCRAL